MNDWLGLIGAIVGVIVAWGLALITKFFSDSRKATRDINTTAFVCLDRLLKIQNAETRNDNKQVDHELYLLGRDLDLYRDCIAASPKMRKNHWSMYRRMIPILLEHDLSKLDCIIKELETISGAND